MTTSCQLTVRITRSVSSSGGVRQADESNGQGSEADGGWSDERERTNVKRREYDGAGGIIVYLYLLIQNGK